MPLSIRWCWSRHGVEKFLSGSGQLLSPNWACVSSSPFPLERKQRDLEPKDGEGCWERCGMAVTSLLFLGIQYLSHCSMAAERQHGTHRIRCLIDS